MPYITKSGDHIAFTTSDQRGQLIVQRTYSGSLFWRAGTGDWHDITGNRLIAAMLDALVEQQAEINTLRADRDALAKRRDELEELCTDHGINI